MAYDNGPHVAPLGGTGGADDGGGGPAPAGAGPTGTNDDAALIAQQKAAADAAAAAAAAKAADDQYKSHYEYGGWAGGASEAAGRYAGLGAAAQGRQGEQLALGAVNDDRNQGQGARLGQVGAVGGQMGMAGLLAARANGSMPSIAGMRANQDIGRALADQSSIAASARGPAALALAQQNQANNSAAAVGNISNTAQINGAQEQLNNTLAAGQAYGAAGQSYTGIRAGDQSLMGADAGVSIAQAQINAAQRDANDRYQLGMTGYETGVQGAQLQAQGNEIAGERGAYATQQGIDLAHDQNSTAKTTPWITGGLGAGAAVGGAVVGALLNGGAGSTTTPNAGLGGSSTTNPTGGAAGASAGDPSGSYGAGSTLGGGTNVADVYGAGSGFMPQSTQVFKAAPAAAPAAIPTDPITPQRSIGTSDARAKVPTSLSTTHDDTTGPAAPSVGMASMIAAKQQQAEREKKAKEYSGLVAGVVNGLGQAFAQQPQQARITPVVAPQQQITLSDDRTKLAAAWDQGHNAALDKVQQYRTMTPAELKNVAARGDRVAAAVRGAKADAYDEARGQNQSMASIPVRQPTSFTRGASTVDTALTPDDEKAYQSWKTQYAPNDSGGDYDLRGAYKAGIKPDPQSGHWPDTFKKPNHPTFSDESQYAKQGSPGHWDGDMFIPPPGGQQATLTTQSDARTKNATSGGRGATHRSPSDGGGGPSSDIESLGPSGEGNYDEPDYNYVKTRSPLDVSYALEQKNGSISPETEAYMRKQGMWDSKTDALLKDRGLRTTSDDRTKTGMSMSSMLGSRRDVGTLGKEVSPADTAEFARSLRSVPYSYKPDYAAREGQAPGEVNVGPVAQEVEKSRIGSTIVKPDPAGSGMRTLDQAKMVKGLGSIAAAHQDKLDEHERTLSLMARRLGGAR